MILGYLQTYFFLSPSLSLSLSLPLGFIGKDRVLDCSAGVMPLTVPPGLYCGLSCWNACVNIPVRGKLRASSVWCPLLLKCLVIVPLSCQLEESFVLQRQAPEEPADKTWDPGVKLTL